MNQKYIVKVEKNNLEQSFKISELDYIIKDVEDIKRIFDEKFIQLVLERFDAMEHDLEQALCDF